MSKYDAAEILPPPRWLAKSSSHGLPPPVNWLTPPIRRRREITIFSILGSFLEYFTPVRAYDGISGSAVHLRTVRRGDCFLRSGIRPGEGRLMHSIFRTAL